MSKQAFIIFYISIFALFTKVSSQKSTFIIKEILPYSMNATAAYISLTDLGIKKYAYFSFDFSNSNIAYFKITTESSFSHSNVQLLFSEKEVNEINKNDLENYYVQWHFIRGYAFKKVKNEQGFDSYLKVEKYNKNCKTLIIRIDVDKLGNDITAENLESLPEDNSLNKNNYNEIEKNLHHWKDNYNKNNNNYNNNNYHYNHNNNNHYNHNNNYPSNHNNYHNYGMNNNQRDYNNEIHNRYYHYHQSWRAHSHDTICETNAPRIIYGLILSQIWIVILILYCLVNRRKRNVQYTVAINNV